MKFNRHRSIQFVVIFLIGLTLGYGLHTKQPLAIIENKSEINQETTQIQTNNQLDLGNFWKVYNTIKDNYFDASTFSSQKQVDGAIKGLVDSLDDPYTVYMDPQENEAFKSSLDGSFEGIGAELSINKGGLVVIAPLKQSPAELAGLKAGDIIYKIGDEFTADMTLMEAIMKIRGEKGTFVVLTVLRENETEPLVISIKRDTISIPSVEYNDLGDDIYHINLYQFGETTNAEFQKAVQELLLKSPKGIILDLRGDGGGYVDAAIDVLSEFVLGKKEAVKIKYRDPSKNYSMYTNEKGKLNNIPMAVLIDEGSASASEIVAGALQDWGRAVLIGVKSFGKGSVQELDNSFDNGASLRITVAHWFTPNDRSIQDLGVTPDQIVQYSQEGYPEGMDSQLDAAIKLLK